MKKSTRIIALAILMATIFSAIPFYANAANAYWGFDDYETIEQPGAPAEITSYPTTIKKVNANVYKMTSSIGGGRTISISLIKEAWGTYNLGDWILTDNGTQHNFTGASTDMEYVHLSQTKNGGICYTGGNHGNEAFISIDFYNAETGAKLDFTSQTTYETNGVHVIEKTKLLRFNDGNSDSIGDYDGNIIKPGNYTDDDVNAEITRKYTFTGPQIKLNVDYKFVRDTRQWRSYNCMLPIDKRYSRYCDMIDKNGSIIKTVTSRPYGDTSIANYAGPQNEGNDATRAVVYSKDYPHYQFDIRVNTYKDSLNEHKNATYKTSYWDMNSTHNKLYFTKYGDGGSMEVLQKKGQEYHTECIWMFNYVTTGREPSEGEIPVSRGKSYTNDINTGSLDFNTSYGAKLTDGIASDVFDCGDGANDYGSMIDDSWYLFSMYSTNVKNGIGEVVIDLKTEYDISKVRLHLANVAGMSIGAPSSIKAYASVDNSNFSEMVTVPTQSGANDIYWTEAKVTGKFTARYVKFEFVVPTGLAYVNEIEVYGSEPVKTAEDNLASGKQYDISVTNKPVIDNEYGTNYSANLTDGKAATQFNSSNGDWFIFSAYVPNVSGGKGTVTIKFDKICDITEFRLHLINNPSWGVNAPKKIEVYVTNNEDTDKLVGEMPIDATATNGYWSELAVENVKAGMVKYVFTLNGGFALLNEVEIHGKETATDFHVCSSNGDDWSFNETTHWHVCDCGEKVDEENHNADKWTSVSADTEARICEDCDYVVETRKKSEEPVEPIGLRGDVNKNGAIDSRDYVTLKRAYFKTAKLDEVATKLADINNNGSLDSRDYVTLKRVYFKTAVIKEDIKYVY